MNLSHNLECAARFFGDSVAVIEGDERYTYAQLNRLAGLVGTGLKSVGVGPGEKVALCAPNSVAWLAIYFGTLKCGAVAVTLSHQLTPQELPRLLAHSHPKVLFITSERLDVAADLKNGTGVEHIIYPRGNLDIIGLPLKGSPISAQECSPRQTACILYTGGTTGDPKGVLLSHENVLTAIHNVIHHERSTHGDRALCFLPFNHVFAQMHIMNATVATGGSLVILPGFDMEHMLTAIGEHLITRFFAVPTVYVRLLLLPKLAEYFTGVRYCFSAASSMAREVVAKWKEATGLDVYEAYGMTETASMVTYNHFYRHKIGSVGTPVGTTEVSIKDPHGNPLPQGCEGEICIRGRNVMQGYLDNPQATAEALKDGWLHSGDVGYIDEEGYLFIVDRLKDLIITGGENVFPREVEEVLYQRPEVAECVVIGLPDSEYGERVTAFIIPAVGAKLDDSELRCFLKERLSPFKVPKEFIAVSELPKSSAGKILKRKLRDQFLNGQSPV